jgi:glycosyltransferase involved in cell wall biosynthesis
MKILIGYSAAFNTPRLLNQAKILKSTGHEIHIAYWERGVITEVNQNKKLELQNLGYRVHEIKTVKTGYGKGFSSLIGRLQYVFGLRRLIDLQKYHSIHLIDFDSAVSLLLLKRNKKNQPVFIYDIADFIQSFDSYTPSIVKYLMTCLENEIFKRAKHIILPDKNRLSQLPDEFHDKAIIIQNTPIKIEYSAKKINITDNRINLIYYGGFSHDRGINELLIIAECYSDINFHFAGWGQLGELINFKAKEQSNIYFHGNLDYNEIFDLVSLMDLIYIFYNPEFEHNKVASPNKLFEALYLNIPLLVAKNTSIDEFVEKYNIGFISNYNESDLKQVLKSIDKSSIKKKKKNIPIALKELGLDKIPEKLIAAHGIN